MKAVVQAIPSEFAWLRDLQRTLRLYEIRFGQTLATQTLRQGALLRMTEIVKKASLEVDAYDSIARLQA